ncbi:MAG: divergent polysaccharide deacetylase family protein [Treponemataceae bacterium]|nr:divergent polysaccharide deacetylase family protein [Treponemataceae bacterium]
MSAQKKTVKRKSLQKRRASKKTRVALDSKKVAIASACVCAFCVLLLAVSALFSSRRQEAERPLLVEREVPQTNSEIVETPQSKSKEDFKVPPKPERAETPLAKIEKEVNRNDDAKKNSTSKKIEENSQNESSKQVAKNSLPPQNKSEKKSYEKNAASKNQSSAAPQDFGFPPASKNAVLCVVFDDGGQNVAQLKKCIALPFPVTVAVLPRLSHSKECAALVRQSGNEVILHQPMQAINLGVNPGEGAILPQMSGGEIAATLSQNIAELAPISGINNHEGSLITEDEVKVGFVLETVHQKGIYFLDSRTSSATKIPSVAMEMGFSYFQRDIFLDNEKSRENILSELKRGVEIANRQGFVIMIGHVWSAEILPSVLEEVYPELKKKGYRFSTVSNSGAQRK